MQYLNNSLKFSDLLLFNNNNLYFPILSNLILLLNFCFFLFIKRIVFSSLNKLLSLTILISSLFSFVSSSISIIFSYNKCKVSISLFSNSFLLFSKFLFKFWIWLFSFFVFNSIWFSFNLFSNSFILESFSSIKIENSLIISSFDFWVSLISKIISLIIFRPIGMSK